jgi:hypothetical protein
MGSADLRCHNASEENVTTIFRVEELTKLEIRRNRRQADSVSHLGLFCLNLRP